MSVIVRRIAQSALGRLQAGRLVIVEDGARRSYGPGPAPVATVEVRSPKLWRKLLRGSRGLAQSYVEKMWDSPDVTAVIRLAARNMRWVDRLSLRLAPLRAPIDHVRGLVARNTRRRSRRDIAAHYDLGGDLFEAMLDSSMTYSCALFERDGMTLAEAQAAKLERVCEKLELSAEDHVLEIGTGWGGFAIHAARTRGCRVTTTTISRDQQRLAGERVRDAGVGDRVTILLDDYRDLHGRYDKLVSIEMIEAVGWQHFGTFFAKCSDLLTAEGAMLLQAITIDDRYYDVEKARRSFIKTYVFPHGCLPSLAVIRRCLARRTDMHVVELEDLTRHYPETLRRWRSNFHAHAAGLAARGYDERFRRLWTLYLSWCEAGFEERRIGDVQLLLAKPRWRSRAHHLDARLAVPAPG
jgi:cyclopropane-fatty-acyl-phospholipid synthase